ncbi:MAG: hypothetical protein ACI4OI_02435 [Gemmiger sp.]
MRFKRMMAGLVAVSMILSCMATNAFADNDDAVGPNTSQGTGQTPEDDEALKAKQDEENSVQQSDDQNSDDQTGGGGTTIGGEIVPPESSNGDQADGTDDNNANPDGNTTTSGGTSGGDTSQSATLGSGTTGGDSLDVGTSESSADEGDKKKNDTKDKLIDEGLGKLIAETKANGTWGQEYTTCEKCGKHDWWKMPDGTFRCKDCGFTTTGVKETSNVTMWSGGSVSLTVQSIEAGLSASSKELESIDTKSSKGTVNDSQLIKITPEAALSLNPVQAMADKRELDYLNSVLKYQLNIAAREQNYLESVQQQQQAAIQREDAYTEMVLTVAAQLQQEAEKREAAYAAAVIAARQAQQEAEAEKGPVKARESMKAYFVATPEKTVN